MDSIVKEEIEEGAGAPPARTGGPVGRLPGPPPAVIELSSSDSDSEAEAAAEGKRPRDGGLGSGEGGAVKRLKAEGGEPATAELPLGFLDPLPLSEKEPPALPPPPGMAPVAYPAAAFQGCKQFWKAGDYDAAPVADPKPYSAGMDHVRVHPKFLHSNATSHKWALGALAELLDNSLDEVCNGATYVNIDMLVNKKDGSRMLLVEDNGGGMDPDKVRHCMSLGYSAKCKMASTIGQYGNGFKTSTMRLGADVIVFSRSHGKDGRRPTQSIGMLSYTFLKNTGKEDIVVPMLDYEKGETWNKMMRSSLVDWNANLETIVQWSPYSSEADLLQQFSSMKDQGTRIVIYNLWEDEQGELELDFDADKHDIQVRGVNRDEKKIQMAKQFPNSRHFLTYRHSLRSYASILYLRLPRVFRMILRGKEIEHHNIVNDMMLKQEVTYRPQPGADGVPRNPNMVAVVTIGFVKDAKDHIDVQGFNVYHKNRLIKPFWRVWNAAGSDGRGVIGVLEANFVEPAHDKQGFERTTVLSRLEARLVIMQKQYWSTNCHKIGYAPRRNKKFFASDEKESSPDGPYHPSSWHSRKDTSPSRASPDLSKSKDSTKARYMDKSFSGSSRDIGKAGKHDRSGKTGDYKSGNLYSSRETRVKSAEKLEKHVRSLQSSLPRGKTPPVSDESEPEMECIPSERSVNDSGGQRTSLVQKSSQKGSGHSPLSSSPFSVNNGTKGNHASNGGVGNDGVATRSQTKAGTVTCKGNELSLEESKLIIKQLKDENEVLKDRLMKKESIVCDLEYERDRNKSLTEQLEEAQKKLEEANKEQEALIDIFSEERSRRDREEENLRKKLKDALVTIQVLRDKLSTN